MHGSVVDTEGAVFFVVFLPSSSITNRVQAAPSAHRRTASTFRYAGHDHLPGDPPRLLPRSRSSPKRVQSARH